MHKNNSGWMGRRECRSIPESIGWSGMGISAIWTSMFLALLLCSISTAQADECYYAGQTYQFNTICNDSWEYLWTATDGTFDGNITSDNCTVNWTAPMVSEKTNVSLYLTVYNNVSVNVSVDQLFESCIDMDDFNLTVCPLGSITIIKDTIPNDDQEFWFTTVLGDFGLIDLGANNSKTFNDLLPGTYIFNETVLYCWNLSAINCSGNATVEFGDGISFHPSFLPGDTSVKITLEPGNTSTCTFTNILKQPGINITKTANTTGPVEVDDQIKYEIQVCNTGEVNLTNVTIYDDFLPDSPFSIPGTLVPGQCANVTPSPIHIVDQDDVCRGSINNTANAYAFDECTGPVLTSVNGTWNISTNYTSSLNITKTANTSGPVGPDDVIEYTITVCNTGDINVTDVVVHDSLTGDNDSIGLLEPGECKSVIEIYPVEREDLCQPIINVANATGVNYCEQSIKTEIDAIHTIPTAYNASLNITKTANRTEAALGDVILYEIVVTNTGNVSITDLEITDDKAEPGYWTEPVLEPGANKTVQATHTVNDTDVANEGIENTATAKGQGPCGPVDPVIGTEFVKVLKPSEFEVRKIANVSTAESCDYVEYRIQIRTDLPVLTNVTVRDVFDKRVDFISAYDYSGRALPMGGSGGIWSWAEVEVKDLPVDKDGWRTLVVLVIKIPERQDFEFDMAQGVSGAGFVNVKNDYSTTFQAYDITNCVYVTLDEFPGKVFSDCVCVTVLLDPGTELSTREHGSGSYESEELVTVKTENKSILMEKDMAATYSPTTIGLYRGRDVTYSSKWTQAANAKNRVTGASMSEEYRYATWIDRESRMFLDENESVMNINSQFDGMGHIGFLKMPTNASTPHDKPIIEVREDYVGSFKIMENIDEYGRGVSYNKSASGGGLVVGDRRIGGSQRSYESGSGTYDSEEVIETYTNYIAKDISITHAPISQPLTDGVSVDASMKWKEGIYSVNPGSSYLGEEYTSITELDKETVAKGLNEMNTLAEFSGQARYRALFVDENDTKPSIDFDEQYTGDYRIERRVLMSGAAKYDRPHLNVTKTLDGIVAERDECDGDNCSKTRYIATYTITIENDGNAALAPIYVKDLFPPGAVFESSSLRPSELGECCYANWTLTHLSIGGVATITLELDVTKYYPSELVNRVEVCGGINSGADYVCASNFSALEKNWLTCCLNETVSVAKTAEVDGVNKTVVWYRIDISNNDNVTRVATVTDFLPEGMVLLDSMVPFASYDGRTITWNLIDIEPYETVTIPYRVEAKHPGRFVNSVEVDPRSVDGPVVQPVRTNSVVDVGEPGECESTACGLWSPPNWGFEYVGYYAADLTCEDLTCDEGHCGLAP